MGRRTRHYADPPEDCALRELIYYFYDQGVGLPLGPDGTSGSWTDTGLEAALEEIGVHVDRRSIQSWLSGSAIPRNDKLKGLARLASTNRFEREKWAAAFLKLRRQALDARKASRAAGRAADAGDGPGTAGDTPARRNVLPAAMPDRAYLLAGAGALIVVLGLTGAVWLGGMTDSAPVRNITFCDEAHFSTREKACTQAMTQFPDDLKTLMVTFDLNGVPEGAKFTRKWYRNGRQIHEKSSFNDEAWPGYTYWYWPDSFDTGAYALQIVVGDEAVTRTFQVGEGDGTFNFR